MNWRRIFYVGLIGLFGGYVALHFRAVAELARTLRTALPAWIALALAVQLLWFLNQTALYQSLYALLELPARLRQLLPIVLASNFINFVTPSASLGALPLFLDDAEQRGLDAGRVTLTNLLRLLLNLVWFSLLLAFTLAMLFRWHGLRLHHVIAAIILFASAALMLVGLVLAGVRPAALERVLIRVGGAINWAAQCLRRSDLVRAEDLHRFAGEFSRAAGALWTGRWRLVRPILHIILFDGLQIVVLYLSFRAFPGSGPTIDPARLVAIFGIGVLFSVVAITPQGVGAVEGTMIALAEGLGLPMGRAVAVILVYRGMIFWVPLLAGGVALRWVRGLGASTSPSPSQGDAAMRREVSNDAPDVAVRP